jgi:hypothetical protein
MTAQLPDEAEPLGGSGALPFDTASRETEPVKAVLVARGGIATVTKPAPSQTLSAVLWILRHPRSAAKLGARGSVTWLGPRAPVDHLARIEHEREVATARARAAIAVRRYLDMEMGRLGGDQGFGLFDVEERAWDLALEDRDAEALAAHRQEELDKIGDDADQHAADALSAHCVHAVYDLADKLGEVLRSLQRTDPSEVEAIASDLRERLSGDGETLRGAVRARARTIDRYRTAMALRVIVEAYGLILWSYLSAWPSAQQAVEESELRAIVFGGDR